MLFSLTGTVFRNMNFHQYNQPLPINAAFGHQIPMGAFAFGNPNPHPIPPPQNLTTQNPLPLPSQSSSQRVTIKTENSNLAISYSNGSNSKKPKEFKCDYAGCDYAAAQNPHLLRDAIQFWIEFQLDKTA